MQQDRRYLRTERLLREALLALLLEEDYTRLTVEQIAARAGVARKTFYAHYEHRDDLLWQTLEHEFSGIVAHMTELDTDTLLLDGKPLSYPVFRHVQQYRRFYRAMLSEAGTTQFLLKMWDYVAQISYAKHAPLRQMAAHISVPPPLIAQMMAGALLGAVRWWLAEDPDRTPEAMAYTFSLMMAPGVAVALGLEEL